MKLLLDANLSWRLTSVLSEHFGECVHVNKTELPKVEAWENGRNKLEGASRRLLEVVRDDPGFLRRFQA